MSSTRTTVIIVLVLVILSATGSALLLLSRPDLLPKMLAQLERFQPKPITIAIKPPLPTATPQPTETPGPILVYVTGEVALPGTQHRLPYASRVAEAVAAAGGFTERANQNLVNLAGVLRDGDHVHAPSTDSDAGEVNLPTPAGGALVRINSASQEELETLPSIGPAMALRIIEYREQVSYFSSLADLDNVPGIGPATLEKLKDRIAYD